MKNRKYHTVGTVPKSDRKNRRTRHIDNSNTNTVQVF